VVTLSHYGSPDDPRYPAVVEERYEFELAQSARVLDNVDRTLERLSGGAYGSCETCGAPILGADLDADPTRRVCEQHLALGAPGDPNSTPAG
jgi:RNA polymerase-binding transcription factor DksA